MYNIYIQTCTCLYRILGHEFNYHIKIVRLFNILNDRLFPPLHWLHCILLHHTCTCTCTCTCTFKFKITNEYTRTKKWMLFQY